MCNEDEIELEEEPDTPNNGTNDQVGGSQPTTTVPVASGSSSYGYCTPSLGNITIKVPTNDFLDRYPSLVGTSVSYVEDDLPSTSNGHWFAASYRAEVTDRVFACNPTKHFVVLFPSVRDVKYLLKNKVKNATLIISNAYQDKDSARYTALITAHKDTKYKLIKVPDAHEILTQLSLVPNRSIVWMCNVYKVCDMELGEFITKTKALTNNLYIQWFGSLYSGPLGLIGTSGYYFWDKDINEYVTVPHLGATSTDIYSEDAKWGVLQGSTQDHKCGTFIDFSNPVRYIADYIDLKIERAGWQKRDGYLIHLPYYNHLKTQLNASASTNSIEVQLKILRTSKIITQTFYPVGSSLSNLDARYQVALENVQKKTEEFAVHDLMTEARSCLFGSDKIWHNIVINFRSVLNNPITAILAFITENLNKIAGVAAAALALKALLKKSTAAIFTGNAFTEIVLSTTLEEIFRQLVMYISKYNPLFQKYEVYLRVFLMSIPLTVVEYLLTGKFNLLAHAALTMISFVTTSLPARLMAHMALNAVALDVLPLPVMLIFLTFIGSMAVYMGDNFSGLIMQQVNRIPIQAVNDIAVSAIIENDTRVVAHPEVYINQKPIVQGPVRNYTVTQGKQQMLQEIITQSQDTPAKPQLHTVLNNEIDLGVPTKTNKDLMAAIAARLANPELENKNKAHDSIHPTIVEAFRRICEETPDTKTMIQMNEAYDYSVRNLNNARKTRYEKEMQGVTSWEDLDKVLNNVKYREGEMKAKEAFPCPKGMSKPVKPRTVISCHPLLNVRYSWFFSRLHKHLATKPTKIVLNTNTDAYLYFKAGSTWKSMSYDLNQTFHLPGYHVFVGGDDSFVVSVDHRGKSMFLEMDATGFDATINKSYLDFELQFYEAAAGNNKQVFNSQSYMKIQCLPIKFRTYPDVHGHHPGNKTSVVVDIPGRSSGYPSTTVANSSIMALIILSSIQYRVNDPQYLGHAMLTGLAQDISQRSGMKMKEIQLTDIIQKISFLRGWFALDANTGTYVHTPSLGRLVKYGKTFTDPATLFKSETPEEAALMFANLNLSALRMYPLPDYVSPIIKQARLISQTSSQNQHAAALYVSEHINHYGIVPDYASVDEIDSISIEDDQVYKRYGCLPDFNILALQSLSATFIDKDTAALLLATDYA